MGGVGGWWEGGHGGRGERGFGFMDCWMSRCRMCIVAVMRIGKRDEEGMKSHGATEGGSGEIYPSRGRNGLRHKTWLTWRWSRVRPESRRGHYVRFMKWVVACWVGRPDWIPA